MYLRLMKKATPTCKVAYANISFFAQKATLVSLPFPGAVDTFASDYYCYSLLVKAKPFLRNYWH